MGEIKSTLDLVMERTRNLSLTKEEKLELAINEFRSSFNGLLQKYKDGLLDVDHFLDQLQQLQVKHEFKDRRIAIEEICKRLDLNHDNQWALRLLNQLCATEAERIKFVLEEYRSTLSQRASEIARHIREDLSKAGISGTAVEPNLEAHENWEKIRNQIHSHFAQRLKREIEAVNV